MHMQVTPTLVSQQPFSGDVMFASWGYKRPTQHSKPYLKSKHIQASGR